ncbi:hypothetical protein [Cellulomonas sp. S1-8]|uniref:hypothetical protein n=1 Tax=Cellulomonas sp. S1-8 TaxID=2904790 RepID=UPI002243262D|nr:hypothetical protein [Cellulomonas sp. S1-8]UZN02615.1 hypothetical protein OKX07_16390 [Cellulomonas sp. S1-8]
MSEAAVSSTAEPEGVRTETAEPAATPSAGTRGRLGLKGYGKYLALYVTLTIGVLWGVVALYLPDYEYMAGILGELETTSPVVVLVLHSPAIAAFVVLFWYDGWRGVANYLRTWVPRRKDLVWIPVLMGLMLLYIFAVRWVCQLFGIEVPPEPMGFVDGLVRFLELSYMEVGMIAIAIGWFGFFLPLMHRATGSRVRAGALTGLGIGIFVAPGNVFASFELATAWPLYTAQLCVLGIGMSLLMSRLKGNTLFFLLPFWVSASGSHFGLYFFTKETQVVQISLFTALVFALYFVLKAQGGGRLEPVHTFPEYLENAYTTRVGAPFPGKGDRSKELAAQQPTASEPA